MPGPIMIVDDEDGVRLLIGLMLERGGFEVVKAADGQSALNILEDVRPGLFILDIMMPGIDGIELCRRIRARPETARTPIVMLTALGDTETITLSREAGADQYIRKPVLSGELLATVRAMINSV